jgi:CRP/FNR family transcriptional regulator
MADNYVSAGDARVAQMVSDPALGARRRSAMAGALLYEPGRPAEEVFVIQQGQVRLYQLSPGGSRRLVDILGPGQWFGSEAVGGLGHYECQARAETAATLCVLPAGKMLAALVQRPETSLEIIRQLSLRLHNATEEAGGLAFEDCRARLLRALLKFGKSAAAKITGESVELHMTHEQLAQAVGAARETVSLLLNDLRRENLIRTGRNRICFDTRVILNNVGGRQPSRSSTIFS